MEFKILTDTNDEIKRLRYNTFVVERNVPEELEFDGKDNEFLHFTLWDGEKIIACLRVNENGDLLHMGRFAVEKELRKNGYGKILMEKLTEYAKEKGYAGIELSAVETAVGFYEKQGFITIGDYYLETGVPHIYMKKEFTLK